LINFKKCSYCCLSIL